MQNALKPGDEGLAPSSHRPRVSSSEQQEYLEDTTANAPAQQMSLSNRLPILAEEVKRAHAGVVDAAKTAAERAIEAGRALNEAKSLLKHGEWLPWLRDHAEVSERTAQLYMRIAALGLKSETVADIGLKAAAKVMWTIETPNYNPYAHVCDAEVVRWELFKLFIVRECDWRVEGACYHIEWVLQKQFSTVEEWLGEEGHKFRRFWGARKTAPEFIANWARFAEAHSALDAGNISEQLVAIAQTEPTLGPRRKKRRGRQEAAA